MIYYILFTALIYTIQSQFDPTSPPECTVDNYQNTCHDWVSSVATLVGQSSTFAESPICIEKKCRFTCGKDATICDTFSRKAGLDTAAYYVCVDPDPDDNTVVPACVPPSTHVTTQAATTTRDTSDTTSSATTQAADTTKTAGSSDGPPTCVQKSDCSAFKTGLLQQNLITSDQYPFCLPEKKCTVTCQKDEDCDGVGSSFNLAPGFLVCLRGDPLDASSPILYACQPGSTHVTTQAATTTRDTSDTTSAATTQAADTTSGRHCTSKFRDQCSCSTDDDCADLLASLGGSSANVVIACDKAKQLCTSPCTGDGYSVECPKLDQHTFYNGGEKSMTICEDGFCREGTLPDTTKAADTTQDPGSSDGPPTCVQKSDCSDFKTGLAQQNLIASGQYPFCLPEKKCTVTCQKDEDCDGVGSSFNLAPGFLVCSRGDPLDASSPILYACQPGSTHDTTSTPVTTETKTTSVVTRLTSGTDAGTTAVKTTDAATTESKTTDGSDTKTTANDDTKTTASDDTKTTGSDDTKTTGNDDTKTTASDDTKTTASDDTKTTGSDDTKTTGSDDTKTTASDDTKTTASDDTKTTGSDDTKTTGSDDTKTTGTDDTRTTSGDSKTTGDDGTSDTTSSGDDTVTTAVVDCKKKDYFLADVANKRECTDDEGDGATECALHLTVEMNVCVLNQLFLTEKVHYIIKETVYEIIQDWKISSLSCERGYYYPKYLYAKRNDDITEDEANTRIADTPATGNCPKPAVLCPVSDSTRVYPFFQSIEFWLRCSNCEVLQKLLDRIKEAILDASMKYDFDAKLLEKSEAEDTACGVGFGAIDAAKISVALFQDGVEVDGTIINLGSNDAVQKQWMVGVMVVLAVFLY
eukprot:266271_1